MQEWVLLPMRVGAECVPLVPSRVGQRGSGLSMSAARSEHEVSEIIDGLSEQEVSPSHVVWTCPYWVGQQRPGGYQGYQVPVLGFSTASGSTPSALWSFPLAESTRHQQVGGTGRLPTLASWDT